MIPSAAAFVSRYSDLNAGWTSTRDLLNTPAVITDKKAGFRSLGDTWAEITTPHDRLMLTVLGGLAEFAERAMPQEGSGLNRSTRSALLSLAANRATGATTELTVAGWPGDRRFESISLQPGASCEPKFFGRASHR